MPARRRTTGAAPATARTALALLAVLGAVTVPALGACTAPDPDPAPRGSAAAETADGATDSPTDDPTDGPTDRATEEAADVTVPGAEVLDAGGRPVQVVAPAGHDATTPAPLVLVLHGFGADPADVDALLGLRDDARERDVLYALPQGTEGPDGRRFWNASDACCDFAGSGVDDVTYLEAAIDAVEDRYAVDPAHVTVVGHSNGGFLAYRAACELAGRVTAVVPVAGAMPGREHPCSPGSPVTVVRVHGTSDVVVGYAGGRLRGSEVPAAEESTAGWARRDGCRATPKVAAGSMDLDASVEGAETTVTTYPGCDAGARVELWTIEGGRHTPAFGDEFADAVLDVVTGG